MESWWQIYLTTIQFFILLFMLRHRMSSILLPDGITQLKKMSQMSSIDWEDVLQSDSTQGAFSFFHNKLRKLHDNCFPLQHIFKKYNTRKPWLSDSLRDAIKKKNKLYRKSLKIKSANNEMVYKNYRNKLKHLLKAAEKKYYSDLVLINKSMWSIIKNIINRNKRKYINRRFKLSDGSKTNDKQLISDKFNDSFINVGPNTTRIHTRASFVSHLYYWLGKCVFPLFADIYLFADDTNLSVELICLILVK